MSIGERRLDDGQLPRLNHRPTRYYLVQGRLEGSTLRQWIVETYTDEAVALKTAEALPKVIITDCRDWTPEELDNRARAVLIENNEPQDQS